MSYIHQVVINHIGKMICRIAVRLQEDKILFRFLFLKEAVDGIAELWPSKGVTSKPYDMGNPLAGTYFRFGRINRTARTRVGSRLACLVQLSFLTLELFHCAKTTICMTTVKESLDVLFVDIKSQRLCQSQYVCLDATLREYNSAHALVCTDRTGRHNRVLRPRSALPT